MEETNERARTAMCNSGARDGILADFFGVVYCSSHEDSYKGRLKEEEGSFGGSERGMKR